MAAIHQQAKRKLDLLRSQHAEKTQELAKFILGMLTDFQEDADKPKAFTSKIKLKIENKGGVDNLTSLCGSIIAYYSNNHLPLLGQYFLSKRGTLCNLLEIIQLGTATQNNELINAVAFLIKNRHRKSAELILEEGISLGFASEKWRSLVNVGEPKTKVVNRRNFELCVFSYLTQELRSGDVFIEGADSFSDYRKHLLSWAECESLVDSYLKELGLPQTAEESVNFLKAHHKKVARKIDKLYPKLTDFFIDDEGNPILKKVPTAKPNFETKELIEKIQSKMPERNLLDILCLSHHLTGWAHELGPISGVESRLENPIERNILNVFGQGTGMGPAQTARHVRRAHLNSTSLTITAHMLSWANRRYTTPKQLDKAKDRVINFTTEFPLITAWGDGSRCAADGTLRDIYEDNLLAESHIRYNGKGGIAYHHISDTYVALFSTFIPCDVWEAVEIIEALIKNQSFIKPDTIHADTQGQSTVVFGLAYLLGIKLMP